MGMQVESCVLVPNETANVRLLNRGLCAVSARHNIGKATTRFGLGILRSNVVAKMTNISAK
jgi:hypothetical protein